MRSLWFVVPAAGRVEMATVCLRQLARTCAALTARGLRASAVVVSDDETLEVADRLGFATVERENRPLGAKWNDGYELAARAGAEFVVPFGSDDWIDPAAIVAAPLPAPHEVRCFLRSAVVREDGRRLARLHVRYGDGAGLQGDGIRIIPTGLLEPCEHRPAEEDRDRAIDTSVWRTLARLPRPPRYTYFDLHDLQIVDWKTGGRQLNSYADCQRFREGDEIRDPFAAVAEFYPADAVEEMRDVYAPKRAEAAPGVVVRL